MYYDTDYIYKYMDRGSYTQVAYVKVDLLGACLRLLRWLQHNVNYILIQFFDSV